MRAELKTTSLQDSLTLLIDYRGKTPKKLGGDWSDSGYMALSAKNIKFDGLVNLDEVRYLDENIYRKWMKEEVEQGDLLLTSEAPSGQVYIWNSDEKIVLSQRLYALRVNNLINNHFLKYYLQSKTGQREIQRNNSGSTVGGISAKTFTNILIKHPELNDQKKVGELLYLLDRKIELNNKINTDLEAMAKLIYDYWFVQFDFPDANGKPYKSSGGKMVYNEALKREIPDGWGVNTLSGWIESDKTGDWGKESKQGNYTLQVDCIRGADINGLNGKGRVKSPHRFILKKNVHKILSPFDLIIEISGGSPTQSTGRMAFLTKETLERFEYPVISSNFCKAISLVNNSYFYNFIYQWNSLYDKGVLFGWEGKTSGIKNLLFDSFVNKHSVCLPPETLVKGFSSIIEPLQQKKQKSLKENSELESLRDWLLPMLMNGQVIVKDS